MHHAHRRLLKRSSEIAIVGLLTSIGLASLEAVVPLYLDSFGLSASTIGFTTAFFTILSLITMFLSAQFLERFHLGRLWIGSMAFSIVGFIAVGLFDSFMAFFVAGALITIVEVFRSSAFAILFRDNTTKKELNRDEGLLYAILNTGWLIGPLIAAYFMSVSLSSVFFVTSAFFLCATLLMISLHVRVLSKKRKAIDTNPLLTLKEFIGNKRVRIPYLMSFGIEFWWAMVYIYFPLFIFKEGISEGMVAVIVGMVAVPLIILEFSTGKLSATKGFRTMFSFGFFGLAVMAFLAFFVSNVYIIIALIVFSGIFAACIEPLQDTFFFKRITKVQEEKFFALFRTAGTLGAFTGRFSIAVFLLVLPTSYAYLVSAVVMTFFGLVALRINRHAA